MKRTIYLAALLLMCVSVSALVVELPESARENGDIAISNPAVPPVCDWWA
ncbi:hypothetical protein JXA85_08305 [Candidatus Woesearchaeota archaeon]|nr:hypothetical protein [Candidatus Woesearchaeota archaeon]